MQREHERYYGYQGQGYPTGAASFSVDLSPQMDAIMQRMVKRRREDIKEHKIEASQNEIAILKALDFDEIKGMTDIMQEKHLKDIEDTEDKWTKKYTENQGILTPQDRLQLNKDARKIKANIVNMQTNIEIANTSRKAVAANPNVYDDDVLLGISKWLEKGDPNDASIFEVMKKKAKPIEGVVMDKYGDMFSDINEDYMSMVKTGKKTQTQINSVKASLNDAIERAWESIQSDPEIKNSIKTPEDKARGLATIKGLYGMADEALLGYGYEEPPPTPTASEKTEQSVVTALEKYKLPSEWNNKGIVVKDVRRIAYFNKILEGIMVGDNVSLSQIITSNPNITGAKRTSDGLIITGKATGNEEGQKTIIKFSDNKIDNKRKVVNLLLSGTALSDLRKYGDVVIEDYEQLGEELLPDKIKRVKDEIKSFVENSNKMNEVDVNKTSELLNSLGIKHTTEISSRKKRIVIDGVIFKMNKSDGRKELVKHIMGESNAPPHLQ